MLLSALKILILFAIVLAVTLGAMQILMIGVTIGAPSVPTPSKQDDDLHQP